MFVPFDTAGFTILIADEQRDSRDLLRRVMTAEGFHLREATSSEEALELVAVQPIHLFLCDLHLPERTGLETVQRARRVRGELPCILLSRQVDAPLMRTALELHVFSILGKPIDQKALLHTTRRALQRTYPAEFKPVTRQPTHESSQGDLET